MKTKNKLRREELRNVKTEDVIGLQKRGWLKVLIGENRLAEKNTLDDIKKLIDEVELVVTKKFQPKGIANTAIYQYKKEILSKLQEMRK